jgi:uncharacterized protein
MKITNEFTVHTPIERAWEVLTDLEGIAPCLPGAQLTGVDGETYSGKVKVKVGPVVSDFAGTARFLEKDEQARRAVIDAKGRDSRSAGNAAAVVTAHLRADGDQTLVSVDTDLKISGKLAQFGSGMIKEVSGKLLGQFVTNLEAKLAAEPTAGEGPATSVPAAGGVTTAASGAASQAETVGGGVSDAPASEPARVDSTKKSDVDDVVTGGAFGAGSVTSGDPGSAVTPSETPVVVSEVATSASSVGGTALRVVPEQGGSDDARAGAVAQASAEEDKGAFGGAGRVPVKAGDEPEALDLLALAGGSVYKRAVPLGIGAVVVAAVIVWFVARR